MPLNRLLRWRRRAGCVLGEALNALILSHGLLVVLVLILNGFDGMAAAHFVHNALERMIEAEPLRQARFQTVFAGFVLFTTILVMLVRFIDRGGLNGRAPA